MTLSIKIIRGNDAHKTRVTSEFIQQWQLLADNTNHVTVFQEPAFVNCWYQQYAPEFEPILILGYDSNVNLVGLLPLALEKNSRVLTHAAAQQVEYSGWLCTTEYKNTFISKALARANQKISYSSWRWSHIPPKAEVDWLLTPSSELKSIHFSHEQIDSPVLDLHDEEKIKKIKKSKSVKSKINRLKRKGELHLEHITDVDRAKQVMALIPDLVNFRHGAAHGDLAFREDPLQHGFYQSRAINLNENHFTALWMDDTLLAFHFGGIDKDTIYIGLTAFDPRESKHSPGVIFIIYLAEMMQQQGIRYIDLTPGGDEYKERFCNTHQTLYRPIIYSNIKEKVFHASKQKAKASILNAMSLIGLDKEKVTNKINKKTEDRQKFNLFNIQLEDLQTSELDEKMSINVQKYNDLLIHQGYSNSTEMQTLLNDATQRFSKEETLFTLMEDKELTSYSWLSKAGAKYKNHGLELSLDKDQVVIDCVGVEKSLPKSTALKKMLSGLIKYAIDNGYKNAFTFIPDTTDIEKIKVFEEFGFKRSAT